MDIQKDLLRTGNVSSGRLMVVGLVTSVCEYMRSMLDKIPGMKVLLLDSETTAIISLVLTQSQILEREVFLLERIDSNAATQGGGGDGEERLKAKMRHLTCVCFLRPSSDNLLRLTRELRSPRFASYHLFFSNHLPTEQLERLARCDEFDTVKQVFELYADILPLSSSLFTLNLPSTSCLTLQSSLWGLFEEQTFARLVDGVFSALCATRALPSAIRFPKRSTLCQNVAANLQNRISREKKLFQDIATPGSCVVLLADRREDCVTPLLTQWTYQAMLHELIGIDNNRVDLRKTPGVREELEEIVMGPTQDEFYAKNLLSNFGELGVAVKQYVDHYQDESKTKAKVESIEDMQKFVEQYPEFRKLSSNVSKHVSVIHEMSRLVEQQHLLDVSSLEQELACSEQRDSHCSAIRQKLQQPDITTLHKLRLVILFALRYGGDSFVNILKDELRKSGVVDEEQVSLVDGVVQYASTCRSADLFQNKNLLSLAKSTIQRSLKGTPNVLTQHKTLLCVNVEQLLKGRLKESDYPSIVLDSSITKPALVVVFVVGGCTYEESRDLTELSTSANLPILLGGTFVHNSRSFLADVAQLSKPATTLHRTGSGSSLTLDGGKRAS